MLDVSKKRRAFELVRHFVVPFMAVVVVALCISIAALYVVQTTDTTRVRSSSPSTPFVSLMLVGFNQNNGQYNTGFVLRETSCTNGTKVELDLRCGDDAVGQRTTSICGFGDQGTMTAKVTLSSSNTHAADAASALALLPAAAIDIVANACLFGFFLCKSIKFLDVLICDHMNGYVCITTTFAMAKGSNSSCFHVLTDISFWSLFSLLIMSVTDGACPSSGNAYTGSFDFVIEGDPVFLGHCTYTTAMSGPFRCVSFRHSLTHRRVVAENTHPHSYYSFTCHVIAGEFDVESRVYESSNDHNLLEICRTTVQTTLIERSNQ
jgi:hypothetical protein